MNRRHYFTAQATKQPQATPPALHIPVSFCRWLCSRAHVVRLLCAWPGLGGGAGGVSEAVWLFPGAPSRQERPQQRLLITAERARPPLPTPSNRRRAGNRNCHPVTKIAIQEGWEWRQEEPGVCQGLPEQWNQHQYHLPPGFLLSEKKKKKRLICCRRCSLGLL